MDVKYSTNTCSQSSRDRTHNNRKVNLRLITPSEDPQSSTLRSFHCHSFLPRLVSDQSSIFLILPTGSYPILNARNLIHMRQPISAEYNLGPAVCYKRAARVYYTYMKIFLDGYIRVSQVMFVNVPITRIASSSACVVEL